MTRYTTRLGVLLALGISFLSGCADEREPINRVQANALDKSFFVGPSLKDAADDPEFYTAATVTDVPFGADQIGAFPGLVGQLRRVKWEILEDVVNARLTYEEIDGVDGHGNRTTNSGRVIASYPIESHFDIKRGYNPQTGEDLNVVEENTSDRPWYERQYMRVDWSTNLVASSMWWDPIAQQSAFGDSVDTESLSYYVDDPSSPDAPVFDVSDGYFDITNKVYVKPRKVTVFGSTVSACLYRGSIVIGGTAPWGNCENSEITLRYSFKKIAQRGEPGFTDYEPIHWDGSRMNAFGIFTADRLGWDDRYGIIDNKWLRLAQRYNIWKASHTDVACNTPEQQRAKLDPLVDSDKNGTHDQCEDAGAGSRCSDLVGLCTIPYAKREVRPVMWHYTVSPEGDDVMFESTQRATQEWDIALRQAVQAARLVECRRTGGGSLVATAWEGQPCEEAFPIVQQDDAEISVAKGVYRCWAEQGYLAPACAADYAGYALARPVNGVANMRPMVALCHNPVAESDDPLCGAAGATTRAGDIRYHHINLWPTRHSSSPWGYGPTLADPLTGEAVSAGINVYNAVTDNAAQSFVDQLRWFSGELPSDAITSGSYIADWADAGEASKGRALQEMAGGFTLSKQEIEKRITGISGLNPADFAKADALKAQFDLKGLYKQMRRDLYDHRLPPDQLSSNRAEFDARINLAKNTPIEAALTNGMWSQLAGANASTLDDDTLNVISPLRGMRSHVVREAEHQIQLTLAQRGQCMVGAPEPTGLPALAKVMQLKFPAEMDEGPDQTKTRIDKMWNYLRSRLNYSVILHEMGHTVGFRHNFTSSFDKFNYRPQYWQLRTNNDAVNNVCSGPTGDGNSCVGPRYWDPMTQEEVDNSIWTWQHTTVMDYPGDLTQDMMGLGVYDYAGARMFYADVSDVVADDAFKATILDSGGSPLQSGTPEGDAIADLVDFSGGLLGQQVVRPGTQQTFMHYSEWNKWFHFIRNCRPADTSAPAGWDESKDGVYSPVFDGHIVLGTVCDRMPVDYVAYRDLLPDEVVEQQNTDPRFFTSRRARDAQGRPRVPYSFESDEYSDGWSPSTYLHDNGADLYEELTFHSNLYENRHIFDNFRNGRVNFTVYGAYQRALSRYHYKLSSLTQGVAYLVGFYLKQFAQDINTPFSTVLSANLGQGSLFYDSVIGASLGFDHFMRVMTRPHVGGHFYEDQNSKDILIPIEDRIGAPQSTPFNDPIKLDIPNGTSVAASGDLAYGGRPLNNDFQFGNGYWSIDYLNQAGSYYEKTYAFESMLEASFRSFNFWRFDGLDGRFHHINFTDLYGDGMRRLIGSMLTGDRELYAPRVSTGLNGDPLFEAPGADASLKFPAEPLGWVSYINPSGPELCWPRQGNLVCRDVLGNQIDPTSSAPTTSKPVDPQLGFEVQKFIAFWSYVYLPGAQNNDWVDMMRIYVVGPDKDPDYLPGQRVEWRDPESGLRYVAKRYGSETLLGKSYDKGIAAKMIQWQNALTAKGYEVDASVPFDPVTGAANVVYDSNGRPQIKGGAASCDETRDCSAVRAYRGLLDFMRDTAARLGFPEPALQVYGGD